MASETSTLFHITHWKAGSQWIMKILAALEPGRIVPAKIDEVQFLNEPLIEGAVYPTVYVTKEQFHSVPLPQNYRKFVVIRDLRDTLISGYFSIRYSHPVDDPRLVRWRALLNDLPLAQGLELLMDEWLPASAKIHESWLASGETIIRYEDLLNHAYEIFEDVLLGDCGLQVSREQLREVVASNQFESLTSGRQRGVENLYAHERKGIAGDWRNYFTSEVNSKFNELYGGLLGRSSKYTAWHGTKASTAEGLGMSQPLLSSDEVLAGYDAVAELYPHVPPLSHWRAWEYAAYQKFRIDGRVLDLGCGDGRYFRLIWPEVAGPVGVDRDAGVADAGVRSGVYSRVHVTEAQHVPEPDASFDHVFANCSLEHMDNIDDVLAEVSRCLKPGGTLLCSVVTDRFLDWNVLPGLVRRAGFHQAATNLFDEFIDFHHLVNPLSVEEWATRFRRANLVTEVHIPILPKINCGFFLLMDSLWHVKKDGGEIGDDVYPFLQGVQSFPSGFKTMMKGLMEMESDWADAGGAVFLVRKPLRDPN